MDAQVAKLIEAAADKSDHPYTGEANYKHMPLLEISAEGVTTAAGKISVLGADPANKSLHPITPEHHITAVWVKNEAGEVVALAEVFGKLETAEAVFATLPSGTVLTPYSLCNTHGVWAGPPVTVGKTAY